MTKHTTPISQRLDQLEQHLATENPVLLETIKGFRKLDRVGHKLGLLADTDSFATQLTWWPLISVLGTFSAGKSTFINHYLGSKLQRRCIVRLLINTGISVFRLLSHRRNIN